MSYGTVIFPKVDTFSKYSNFTLEELQGAIDAEIRFMTNKFNNFRGLALCTPHDLFGRESYERIHALVNDYFNDYVESYKTKFELENLLDLKYQVETPISDTLPFLEFPYIGYTTREEVIANVNECTNLLLKYKGQILGLCLGTPIDITPRDEKQYVDGHYEPITYLEGVLDELEDSLEECLRDICGDRLVLKYWDERKQG